MAIPQLEAVTVETEERLSVHYAQMALDRGLHVQMDKPGSEDPVAFERMARTAKEKDLTLHLGYMYRYNPAVMRLMEDVKAGKLGEIHSVEAHMSCRHKTAKRQWLDRFEGGMLFFLGCHLIDLIYRIQGEPDEIIPLSCSTGIGDIHTEDYGMVVYKYSNGVSFAKTCDNECGGFLRRQLVICGEKGTIEIKPLEVGVDGGQYTVSNECFDDSGKHWSTPWETSQSEVHDRYDGMMRNFAEIVRGKENPYSYDYELNLYKLVLRSCGKEI